MNIELGELMRERSAVAEATVRTDRVGEVRRRIARVRRRRVAAGVASTVAVVAAVAAGVALLPGRPGPDPAPVATMRTIDGFPEYQAGARVIGTAAAALPDAEVSITVVPDTLELAFMTRCDTPLWIEVRLAGQEDYMGTTCHPEQVSSAVFRPDPDLFTSYGLAPGQPATFTATAVGAPGSGVPVLPLPERGTFALAVMQRVPFEEYQFPPRPATLPAVDDYLPPDGELVMRADTTDPLRPASGTIAWSSNLDLHIVSQTPGYIHVSVDGTPIDMHENWTYGIAETVVRLGDENLPRFAEGTLVTLTAAPDRMTGDWAIWAVPSSTSEEPA